MTRVAVTLALLLLGCREQRETTSTATTPLTPSGNPVAQAEPAPAAEETHSDLTDQLPPSLLEGNRKSTDKKSKSKSKSAAPADKSTADKRSADQPVADVPPPPPAPAREYVPEPWREDEPAADIPPSLLEGAAQPVDKSDKIDKAEAKADKAEQKADKKKDAPAVSTSTKIAAISGPLCVTTGVAKIGAKIEKPAMRAVAKATDGEAAALTFTYHGETATTKQLASGEVRRQLGLKLRAENGCNLIYVMWRLDPKPMVYVQMKRNPGAKDHKACGAGGYKKIKATEDKAPPELVFGEKHTLRAQIENEVLSVFIDDTLHWRGKLPEDAKDLRGPAGLRSDNLSFDLVDFGAPSSSAQRGNAKCVAEDND